MTQPSIFSSAQKPAPVTGVSGAGLMTTRKSNFDLTGAKLVKRGALVSWHGYRFTVSKVRMGTCYPAGPFTPDSSRHAWFYCNSVQVVA